MGKWYRWPVCWYGLTRRRSSRPCPLLTIMVNRDSLVVLTLFASDGDYFPVSSFDLSFLTVSRVSEATGAQFCLADFLKPDFAILYQRAVVTLVLRAS